MDFQTPTLKDVTDLLERFKNAGWIESFEPKAEDFKIKYTQIGINKLQTLTMSFEDFKESGFEFTSLPAGQARECLEELIPPKFSTGEMAALIGFVLQFRMN